MFEEEEEEARQSEGDEIVCPICGAIGTEADGRIEKLCEYCKSNNIDADFIHVETAEQAKNLPYVFNNFAVFYNGKFKTVNQIDGAAVEKMIKKS